MVLLSTNNVSLSRCMTCYVQGERVGLVGANGQGKSTLVKLMLGELRPKSGTAVQHPQARIGVFAQSNVEDLVQGKGQLTALKHMKALFPEGDGLAMHAVHTEVAVTPLSSTACQVVAQVAVSRNGPGSVLSAKADCGERCVQPRSRT